MYGTTHTPNTNNLLEVLENSTVFLCIHSKLNAYSSNSYSNSLFLLLKSKSRLLLFSLYSCSKFFTV